MCRWLRPASRTRRCRRGRWISCGAGAAARLDASLRTLGGCTRLASIVLAVRAAGGRSTSRWAGWERCCWSAYQPGRRSAHRSGGLPIQCPSRRACHSAAERAERSVSIFWSTWRILRRRPLARSAPRPPPSTVACSRSHSCCRGHLGGDVGRVARGGAGHSAAWSSPGTARLAQPGLVPAVVVEGGGALAPHPAEDHAPGAEFVPARVRRRHPGGHGSRRSSTAARTVKGPSTGGSGLRRSG